MASGKGLDTQLLHRLPGQEIAKPLKSDSAVALPPASSDHLSGSSSSVSQSKPKWTQPFEPSLELLCVIRSIENRVEASGPLSMNDINHHLGLEHFPLEALSDGRFTQLRSFIHWLVEHNHLHVRLHSCDGFIYLIPITYSAAQVDP